ncbi:YIEGIA family protein [Effusibacillus consociatus]|uniref:YIEGIA family protein n=1 Tax=Effusibacillus consociatus TaxID=1117041 RepID=A0ABV9Q6Q4_9BACL
MRNGMISTEHLVLIIMGIIMGTAARFFSLKEDYRQYPTYPNGYLIHLVTGFVAASLGAVAVPAIMTKNFVAVTFLSLEIQQFRDVRKMERGSLKDLENTEYTQRGDAYIDGIAKTFEARNYFALLVALATGIGFQVIGIFTDRLEIQIPTGVCVGLLVFFLVKRFSKGKTVGDIATVTPATVQIKNNQLFVNDIFVSNLVGTDNAQKMIEKEGLAVLIQPNENHYRITLDNYGQRQAILFEVTRALGVKRYAFTRKEYVEGNIVVALVPIIREIDAFVEVVKNTPLLENTKKSHSVLKTNLIKKGTS